MKKIKVILFITYLIVGMFAICYYITGYTDFSNTLCHFLMFAFAIFNLFLVILFSSDDKAGNTPVKHPKARKLNGFVGGVPIYED